MNRTSNTIGTTRQTKQRDAIRAIVQRAGRPLNVQELHKAVARKLKSIGLATVYRAVNAGVDQGWLHPVQLPHSPTRYEPADLKHHHHFKCQKCGRVYDMQGCPGNLKKLLPKGFSMVKHEIVLYGRCNRCNAA